MVYGLSGSAKPFFAAALLDAVGGPCLYVTHDPVVADYLALEVGSYLGREIVHTLLPLEVLACGVTASSPGTEASRIKVLDALVPGQAQIVFTSVAALMGKTMPPEVFMQRVVKVSKGCTISPLALAERLLQGGYRRQSVVEQPGEFALRGGIVDVFPVSQDQPFRLDFAGDLLDSIRVFDPWTQRSQSEVPEVRMPPAKEYHLGVSEAPEVARRIEADLREGLRGSQALSRLRDAVTRDLRSLLEGLSFEGLQRYGAYFYERPASILSYLPPGALIFLDEPYRVREGALAVERSIEESFSHAVKEGKALPRQSCMWASWVEIYEEMRQCGPVYLSGFARSIPGAKVGNLVQAQVTPALRFAGQWKAFVDEVGRLRRSGRITVVLSASTDRARRIAQSLWEEEVPAAYSGEIRSVPPGGSVITSIGSIEAGFQWNSANLVVHAESDIRGSTRRPRRARRAEGSRRHALPDLTVGDHVVHAHHGIGIYKGIRSLEIDGVWRDFVFIQYAADDALYVPTDQMDLISRYVGTEGVEPKVYRLGGNDWARVKRRVSESVRRMALELLELNVAREASPGYSFSPDTPWQAEFEDSFKYEETPDQVQATQEIKRDMEAPKPMDRLLCGDVGYGKTEVAVRAAFKAAMDGKQTALLVPTTILAMQHHGTFKERFQGFPVSVDVLSRFRSQREQEDIVGRLRSGKIDVVIGTHRLLQADVKFHDLGLLIIDEEHRFGVAHKERLKRIRSTVDVLTLSATPIPRTLHMALGGLRDMSVIETPPEDRYPVQTYVVEFDDEIVRQAIHRELDRGGQVFYVHNRVRTIERAVTRLERLAPQARIGVAHGQMKEDDLERIMLDFLDQNIDVLVCTTIIESGLDIANVNTMIVEEAGNLGLAQLYQLRGRIGRSNRVAHAYLTYRQERSLTLTAEKRLDAIKEFTELGSGYRIALRDLEIRGAGNILGPEQHGFIISVGFDMYLRMLEEAVRELKGQRRHPRVQTVVDLRVDAFIPSEYILDPRQKLEMYRRLAETLDLEGVSEVKEELRDRFGHPPLPVENLVEVAALKIRATHLGLKSITEEKRRITMSWSVMPDLPQDIAQALGVEFRRRAQLAPGRKKDLVLRTDGLKSREILEFTGLTLDRLGYIVGGTYDRG
jgi:transcription-repair coupling factor (superfamily II helicase)